MKYIINIIILIYSVSMFILLAGCSNGNDVAGTGSSTGNAKIVGVLLSKDGSPASNAVVTLIPESYNPVTEKFLLPLLKDTVNSNGEFEFDVDDTTVFYNIDAAGVSDKFRYFGAGFKASEKTCHRDTGYLQLTGVMKVIISGNDYDTSSGYLYIPGTVISRRVKDYSDFDELNYTLYIDSVPAGIYDNLIYNELDAFPDDKEIIDSQLIILAADTAVIGEYQTLPVYLPGVFGKVVDGVSSLEEAVVNLIPVNYNPLFTAGISDTLKDTTNADGEFAIRYSDSTILYNLVITHNKSGLALMVDSIVLGHDSLNSVIHSIKKTGVIKVILQDSEIDTAEGGFFIAGTNLSADLSHYNNFDQINYTYFLESVPAGDYSNLIFFADSKDSSSYLFDTSYTVFPAETTVLGESAPLIFTFSTDNSDLPNDDVFAVGADPYEGVWFGTALGEFVRHFNDTVWDVYKAADYGVHSSILSIAADQSNETMWFGTHGSIFSVTLRTPAILNVYDPVTSPFPGGSVYSIAVDKDNVKWFGSYTYGVLSYNGYSWNHYNISNSGLPSAYVYDIGVDESNKKWIATRGGITFFDGNIWNTYNKSNSALLCDTAFCVDIDSSGTVWAGFYDGSIASLKGALWTVYNSSNSLLTGDIINSVAVDLEGVVWFGTDNGHLFSFDDVQWKDYSKYLPEASDRLLDIEVDAQNNKWITTEKAGVVLIDKNVK